MSKYDYFVLLPEDLPKVKQRVIYFGIDKPVEVAPGYFQSIVSFLRIKIPRYRDVDVTVKVDIPSAAKTFDGGKTENRYNWFGISTRALEASIWSAYLFYIRKEGRIEFCVHGVHDGFYSPIIRGLSVPEVADHPVTLRIKVEGDRIQTWVNGGPRHDERDTDRRFIRRGDIYLISYGVLAKIHEVEIKAKKWYAPLIKVGIKTWIIMGIILLILSRIDIVIRICQRLFK
jgi:hypothetical protein